MEVVRIGYARVSSAKQSIAVQVDRLHDAGCVEVFEDFAVSGTKNDQSRVYLSMIDRVRELRADGVPVVIVVVKLDRFSRSLGSLIAGVEQLGNLGASFEALDGGFAYDADNPASRLMLHMLGALAEFERSLILSRMSEGYEAKLAAGMKMGRKPVLRSGEVKAIRDANARGVSVRALAKQWDVSRSVVMRVLGLLDGAAPYVSLDEWEEARDRANAAVSKK